MSAHTWSESDRVTARADVQHVRVDDEVVLWDPLRERVHRLDPVGSLLWEFLDGSATVAELAADVAEVWNRDKVEATAVLVQLFAQLDEANLLEHGDSFVKMASAGPEPGYLANPGST